MFEALSENVSQKELISFVNTFYNKNWIRGNSYTKQKPNLMESKTLPDIVKTKEMAIALYYLHQLVKSSDTNNFSTLDNIDTMVGNELRYWEDKGGYCIYVSILAYALFTRNHILSPSDISYFQGYYDFKLREDFPSFIPFPERQLGIHAWLVVKGSVLDFTANQNKTVFDFKFTDLEMVLGEFPKGYNLYGFKESEKTIEGYYKLFSEHIGLSVEEWLERHTKVMNELYTLDEK